jgi:hypothetical protein
MSSATLYDEDVYAWSRQQADLLRALARRRDLPNDLDLARITEEIEAVGSETLNAVHSLLANILVHALKLASLPDDSDTAGHWRREVRAFQRQVVARYRPSMRQYLDLEEIWSLAVRDARIELKEQGQMLLPIGPECPIPVEELAAPAFDAMWLVRGLRASAQV